jgi:peptidoglycan/LPS O-acetylase OafA/YrhL
MSGAPASGTKSGSAVQLTTLTSLRAIAVVLVLTRHGAEAFLFGGESSHFFRQGSTAVSLFFILSGFVLTWAARPGDSPRSFYRRRFARIYPAYIVALLGSQLALSAIHGFSTGPLLANAALVQSWIPVANVYFLNAMGSWSLGCEAFFYLMFPLVLPWLIGQTARRRWQVGCVAVSAEIALALVTHSNNQVSGIRFYLVYVFPITRFCEFLLGIVLALAVKDGFRLRLSLNQTLAIAGVAYVVAGWVPVYLMWVAVTLVPYSMVLLTAASTDIDGHPTWLHNRWMVRLGTWSYSFYLVHMSVLTVVERFTGKTHSTLLAAGLIALTFPLATVAAGLLYRFVEVPLERRLRNPRRRATAEVKAAGAGYRGQPDDRTHLGAPIPAIAQKPKRSRHQVT